MTIRQPEEHLEVRLLVHTHWDREWYRTVQELRPRLVALVDELLDDGAGHPFLLDGQAVILEDYLDVRPERAADLSAALRRGALEAGPWYVLADALIPSGEGLVRNLLAGRRLLRGLRAVAPDVLYCPDSFGHPAVLPVLALGFGARVVVVWRGYGGRSHAPVDVARWIAPDDSSVLLYHLPPDGYEFGSHLPVAERAAAERWQAIRAVLGPRAATGLALLPVGADHHAPQANLDDALHALARAAAPVPVSRSTLAAFASDLSERCDTSAVPQVRGELRDSYGYTWTLQGTFASRAASKRRYAQVERFLVRDVEPWAALARFRADGLDRRALVRSAWKPVLLCQPHDTLCGCSTDAVDAALHTRLDDAASAGTALREAACLALLGHDANAARLAPADWVSVVIVRNTAPRARSGVAELDVDVVLDDAPVGPASAGIEPRARSVTSCSLGSPAVPIQELARTRAFAREEASRHYPWNRMVERRRVLAWISDVPPLGLATVEVVERRRRPPAPPHAVTAGDFAIEGSGMRIEAGESAVSFTAGDLYLADWIAIEVEGERGDLYTRSAIPHTHAAGTLRRARVTARGPLRAELTCDWTVDVPERRLTSATGMPVRRPAGRVAVRTTIQLDAGAPFARVAVAGDNPAQDIRLRIGFRTGVGEGRIVADAAFGPVEREPIMTSTSDRVHEVPPPTAPLHRYVSTYFTDRGTTVFSDGLAEYEVDAGGTTWVTLLRGVGELSRHNLAERPGHAGYPVATPAAQSLGPFQAMFAFAPHGPASSQVAALVERLADDVLLPLRGETWRTALNPPETVTGPELRGAGLVLATVKESNDGEWVVLRAVNVTGEFASGEWILSGIREAMLSRLDETPLETVAVDDGGRVPFRAGPRAIVTLLVR